MREGLYVLLAGPQLQPELQYLEHVRQREVVRASCVRGEMRLAVNDLQRTSTVYKQHCVTQCARKIVLKHPSAAWRACVGRKRG